MTFSAHLATSEDRPCPLAAVASTVSLLQLARAVGTLLARPSVHPCFLMEKREMLAGVAPVTLAPRLALGGLVAWLPIGVIMLSGDSATRDAALAAINEYARAHGILHVLLSPVALSAEDAAALGFTPGASDCQRRSARPSPKTLG